MSIIETLKDAAELAQAAYSNLTVGVVRSAQIRVLGAQPDERNMADAQADAFATRYDVAAVFDDTTNGGTGTYAVLFRDIATNQVTLAVRGTDGAADWLNANLYLMVGVPPSLNPQFNALRPVVAQWIAQGLIPAGSAVVGHSLGGYLAAALKAANPGAFGSATTVNAPGFARALGGPQVLQAIFRMPVPASGGGARQAPSRAGKPTPPATTRLAGQKCARRRVDAGHRASRSS